MNTKALLELVLLAAVWGASYMLLRVAAPEFGPVALIALRVSVAMVFLLAVLKWRAGLAGLKGNLLPFTVLGLINSVIPFILFAYAALHVTAGFSAVINASVPLFGALVSYYWLREHLTWLRIAGLLIGFLGVVILVWEKIALPGDSSGLAALAALVASFSYGVAANYTKRALTGVPPLAVATGSQIASTVVLAPFALWFWPDSTPSTISWISAIALGVFCTAIAYIMYFRLIAKIGPTRTISVTYLLPVSGALWGLAFLDETISQNMWLGGGVILLGTALTTGVLRWQRRPFSPMGEKKPVQV